MDAPALAEVSLPDAERLAADDPWQFQWWALGLVQAAGASVVHVDVRDGHFAPDVSAGQPVIASLRKGIDVLYLVCHGAIGNRVWPAGRPIRSMAALIEAG